MSASIHINGTGSSIIDTVFVCRSTGVVPRALLAGTPAEVAALVGRDIEALKEGGVKPTRGDIRCLAHGHLVRLAIWNLRKGWDSNQPTQEKLRRVADQVESLGGWTRVAQYIFATRGKVFTPRTLDRLVECTRLQEFGSAPAVCEPGTRTW